jgi:hypothetical protein
MNNMKRHVGAITLFVAITLLLTPGRGDARVQVYSPTVIPFPGLPGETWGHIGNMTSDRCALTDGPCMGVLRGSGVEVYEAREVDSIVKDLQGKIGVLQTDVKTLSNANDALTKRLNDMETRLEKEHPQAE